VLATELEEKVRRYPNERGATIGRRLFLRALKSKGKVGLEGARRAP